MAATLTHIYVRPSARTQVQAVESAAADTETGLAGDHAAAGKRQVTLLDLSAWRAVCIELGVDLAPSVRRANLVVEGVSLLESRGRVLRVGGCEIEIHGETRPCELLDAAAVGLNAALRPAWRGGVFGRIVTGATLRVGDAVSFVEGSDA